MNNSFEILTGTVNVLGDDFMLDENGDFIFGSNGDFFTTNDADHILAKENALIYRGQVCLRESIYTIIQTIKGTFPFDPDFGSDIQGELSKNFNSNFIQNVRTKLFNELIKDDRITSVDKIDVEFVPPNKVNIHLFITPIGQQESSQFVFPYYI